jgi:hypothetical protein
MGHDGILFLFETVSFQKALKPSLCLLAVAKSSRHLFSRFETIPLPFLAV